MLRPLRHRQSPPAVIPHPSHNPLSLMPQSPTNHQIMPTVYQPLTHTCQTKLLQGRNSRRRKIRHAARCMHHQQTKAPGESRVPQFARDPVPAPDQPAESYSAGVPPRTMSDPESAAPELAAASPAVAPSNTSFLNSVAPSVPTLPSPRTNPRNPRTSVPLKAFQAVRSRGKKVS